MKTACYTHSVLIILLLGAMMALSSASCSRKTFLDRDIEKKRLRSYASGSRTIEEQTNTSTETEATIEENTRQVYQFEIFPIDSFTLNAKGDYSGKASRVVISGSSDQLLQINSTELTHRSERTSGAEKFDRRSEEISEQRQLRKARTTPISWYLLLLIPIFLMSFLFIRGTNSARKW